MGKPGFTACAASDLLKPMPMSEIRSLPDKLEREAYERAPWPEQAQIRALLADAAYAIRQLLDSVDERS